ncbi:MAG: hypothetical protein ACLQVI_08620 [Polyangiaceae bacterium]
MRRRSPPFPPSPSARPRAPFTLAAAAMLAALAGCGHKANDADCAFILDRNVEVQMKSMHITDPVLIDKRKTEIQTELKAQLQGCIGKRITDGMLACVARAQTAEAIDECMR